MKLEDIKRIENSNALKKLIKEAIDTFGAETTLKLCSNLSEALKEYKDLSREREEVAGKIIIKRMQARGRK